MTNYKQREITGLIDCALKTMPVVVLTGMRQVGKSTLVQMAESLRIRRYITLDDFAVLEAARRNPEDLLIGDFPITIDEAQKCPELLNVIKQSVDKNRVPGRFLLSGSANFALLRGVCETLAGRAVYLALHPFSHREISGKCNTEPFLLGFFRKQEIPEQSGLPPIAPDEILRGGLPPACLTNDTSRIWLRGYEQTYLERDIRELSQVADIIVFRNFLRLAAMRSGQIVNISELARDAKLNTTTASRYLDLAEASFVIRRIPPFLSNKASRLIKSPKLYFMDSGLACHMAGIGSLDAEADEPLRGAMVETYAVQNLISILEGTSLNSGVYFWNVQGRHEVDLVAQIDRNVIAIEIKSASQWNDRDLSGLKAFLKATPDSKAAILGYNGTQAVALGNKMWAIPLNLLLS